VVTTTHYNLLKEMADVDERFANASVEFDADTLAPTYRLTLGTPGSSSAAAVAARMGMPVAVLDRAASLLEREDRQLDRMLSELQTSRSALERERREAEGLRAEGETVRAEYRAKLERLHERRDKLFDAMRGDLDTAFKNAHAQVAAVIRDLQRGGNARDAAHARERLLALEQKTELAQEESLGQAPPRPRQPVDWTRARAGDAIVLPNGQPATLVALPDKRGRAGVQAGGAKLKIAADQLSPGAAARPERPIERVSVSIQPPGAAARQVDLRGLRVDEAIDRVTSALDEAAGAGLPQLEVIHGIGTGRLREAVRRFLADSPYVTGTERVNDGATLALLG
jgi:DNA mismatch repair protein MutS2